MAKNKIAKEILEWALTIIIPVVAALLIHQYLFTFARVDGTSMLDTLHENNIMGVSRLHYRLNEPQRGEIITCNYPGEGSKLFVKRIIGLPGDVIELDEDGVVTVNGQTLDEPYVDELALGECDIKFPYQVPENRYFVLGDHRATSIDSRSSVIGCVEKSQIVGKVFLRVWPLSSFSLIH